MNYIQTFIFVATVIIVFNSCDNLDKIPSSSNVEVASKQFFSDTVGQSKYSENQIAFMEGFVTFLKGENEMENTSGFELDSENYDSTYKLFIELVEERKTSYHDLINCNEIYKTNIRKMKKDLEPVGGRIQIECQRRQQEVDKIQKALNESLSSTVTGPSTNSNEINGKYVEFKVLDKNLTTKTISGRTVSIKFYDGFNKLVHSVRLNGSNPFKGSDIGYLRYEKNENSEIYKKFANLKKGSFRIETENIAINLDGDLIQLPNYAITNFNYTKDNYGENSTYCPYIPSSKIEEEPLVKEVESIKDKYKSLTEVECDQYYKFIDIIGKLKPVEN